MANSSTKPLTASALPPLPPGWTEHKAPSGHSYFYNAETKESTYRRPGLPPAAATRPSLPPQPPAPAQAPAPPPPARPPVFPAQNPPPAQAPRPYLQLSDPRVANAYLAANRAPAERQQHGRHGGRPNQQQQHRPRHGPVDKPRSKTPIPGCEPWILVYTKYGRRFVYNPTKNASYWRIPEKLKPALLEMDREQVRRKALGDDATKKKPDDNTGDAKPATAGAAAAPAKPVDYDSDEYEEVEVTDDDEGEGDDGANENSSKRQKTEEAADDAGPVEFSEADIAFQLQAMAGGADWDPGMDLEGGGEGGDWQYEGEGYYQGGDEYGDGGAGEEEEDGPALFKALLDDYKINPFSAWEKLVEEGKIFDDPRYTALGSMKARKAVWEEWSRARIKEKRQADEESGKSTKKKNDPKEAYFQLLQQHATTKLYWAEFKRKYRKEPAMRDLALAERDKEKWYREYTNRLKLPQATRKADLLALLKSIPAETLGSSSADDSGSLPSKLTTDMRYLSLDASVRDPLVEAYIGNPQ